MIHAQPEPSPRELRRKRNVSRILEATRNLAAERGLEAVSIKDVASAVNYTPGALYRYFPSKDALISATVVDIVEELAGRLMARQEGLEGESPLTAVADQVLHYLDFADAEPHAFTLIAQLIADPREVIADDQAAGGLLGAMVLALTPLKELAAKAEACAELSPGDSEVRALTLFGALHGCLLLRKQERRSSGRIQAEGLSVYALRSLLIGWGGAPSSVDVALARAEHLRVQQRAEAI